MIKIKVIRDNSGFIREFTIKGHAGYAPSGSDIVCAAISAIAYTAAGGLEEIAGIKAYCEKDGYMRIAVPEDLPQDKKYIVWVILETAVIGFEQVQYKYGDFVKIFDKEV